VGTILKRLDEKTSNTREIKADVWSVSQKIEMFRERMQTQKRFRFSELFSQDRTRNEVVVTFLALLEMIRMKQLQAVQPGPFDEIEICVAEPSEDAPDASDESDKPDDSAEAGEENDVPPLTPQGS
jgi:segregation and condensation protein A